MFTIDQTLDYIVKAITKNSPDVSITSSQLEDITVLEINTPNQFAGQIIGKEGRIIKAIRTILALSYPNLRFSINLKAQTDQV